MTLRTVPSALTFPGDRFEPRIAELAPYDLFLCNSADTEWLTGVPRASFTAEHDPALNEAITTCFVGDAGPVFSAAHGLWHLEAGEAMRSWRVTEFEEGSDPQRHLRAVAAEAGWRPSGPIFLAPSTPFRQVALLREAFPDRELRSSAEVIGPLRARKAQWEVDVMREAARGTLAGIKEACARLTHRCTRLELFEAIRDEILAHGADDVVYGPDCWAIGPTVAVDWTTVSTRNLDVPLEPPCSVSIDVGGMLRGYRSDVGRTIFIGEPPARSADALSVIAEARIAGAPLLSPGRRAHEVDDVTRRLIAARGFGPGQWIPSGHGIGLELHEPPTLGEADTTILEDGNAVTFELAIWQDGIAGAFAEDTVVIRDRGLEWLIDDGDEPILIP